jgi:thiol-disulfide isomerase/thioredoxin
MKKKVVLILTATVLLLFTITTAGCGSDSGTPEARQTGESTDTGIENVGPQVGKTAPGFHYTGTDGESISLSDLRGKAVMLNFWATWCGPCNLEMPLIEKLSEEDRPDIEMLTVNVGESASKVSEFMSEKGYSFPVLLDTAGQIGSMYQVRAIPTTFFIDSKGIIRNIKTGAFLDEAELKQSVDEITGR